MARFFDRTDDLVLRSSVVTTARPMTIAAWFNTNDIDGPVGQWIMGIGLSTNGAEGRFLLISTAGDFVAGEKLGFATATTALTANTWFHGAGTFVSATERNVFLNGVNEATDTTDKTATVDQTTAGGSNTPETFDGEICECGIWDVELTDDEIRALAAGQSPMRVRPSNLVVYWPMLHDRDVEVDYSGNENHSTSITGTVNADHAPVSPILYGTRRTATAPFLLLPAVQDTSVSPGIIPFRRGG